MYQGSSFSQHQTNQCRKKHRRKRKQGWKLFCAVIMIVCTGGLLLALSDRLLTAKVFATPEQVMEAQEADAAFEELQTPETGLEDIEKEPGGPVIFVDAGHGGMDGGCTWEGILEKDINLAIAKQVRDKLEVLGYQVIMSRESDTYITKEDRVKAANGCHADIYVSIHQNSSDDISVSGMEVWYDGTDTGRGSERLAQLVHQQTVKATGALERELRDNAEVHVTRETTMPACLVETGFLSNEQERCLLVTEEYQEQVAEGIVQGIEYFFHPKTMYLTFDDGPYGENTEKVLDVLKERNIKATFFLVGENVQRYPEIAQRIASEGHTIGVHCYTHDYKVLYESVENYVQDFEQARQIIYETTGVEAKLFRFPGGSVNCYNKKNGGAIIEEMTKQGYIYFDWNASLEDAVGNPEAEKLVANGVNTALGRKKVVMLAHDRVYDTGICLGDLLDRLPEYEMKPLSDDVEPIQF